MKTSTKVRALFAALATLTSGCINPEICTEDDTRNIVSGGSDVPVGSCRCSGTYTVDSSCCAVPSNATCCPVDETPQGGNCKKAYELNREGNDPGPGSMEDPTPESGEPQIVIWDFNVAPSIAYGDVPFDIDVTYRNNGNGVILKPPSYEFYENSSLGDEPIMRMELRDLSPPPPVDRGVPWEEIPLDEEFKTEGNFNVPEGTYLRKLVNLPPTTPDRGLYENGINTIVE